MLRRSLLCTLAAVCALGSPSIAAAVPPKAAAADPAQTLFDAGVADMEAGKLEKACPAIEASHRLSPMPGTLFTLAECEAKRGRVATAMRYYAEYLSQYRAFNDRKKKEQKDRADICERQLKKLEPLAPRLTLKLPANAGTDVIVKRDNDIVAELSLGTAVAVDPGEHVITVQVAGAPGVSRRITLAEGESRTVELTLSAKAQPSLAEVASASATSAPGAAPLKTAEPPPSVEPWVIGAWSAGAVSVVGIAIGAVTGVLALEQAALADKLCKPATASSKVVCEGEGYAAESRFATLGAVSTTGFIVGGLALGVGVVLVIARPTSSTPASNVGGGPLAWNQQNQQWNGASLLAPQLAGSSLQQLSLSLRGNF